MVYPNWIEIERKGTTFGELQEIFLNNITTKYIYETLDSCFLDDDATKVKAHLDDMDFDISGVRDENNTIIGYIESVDLEGGKINEYVKSINRDIIIPENSPISELIGILKVNSFSFVERDNSVLGIITQADINKPVVRIYLFGIVSLFEMHLNFWIEKYFENDSWTDCLKESRIDAAIEIQNKRRGDNEDLSLLDCIQICDKKEILSKSKELLESFNYGKERFYTFVRRVQDLRDELAHSKSSIIRGLGWSKFTDTVSNVEKFLSTSEQKIVLMREKQS